MIEGQETKVMSVRDAIIEAMSEEMRRDENVFLMGEDVGVYGGDFGTSVGMLEEFGSERVRDTPISENAISGCAVGAALTGMRPIVDVTFMDFIVYMMDNIVNQAARPAICTVVRVLCPLSSAVLLARVWALLLSTLRVSNHGSATSQVSRS